MEFAELLQQSFLALFAAIGIAWAVWTVVEALFLSRREPLERCLVLVPVTRDAPALERTVAGLQWTTVCGCKFERILIADCGLSAEGRALAQNLAAHGENVTLCTMDDAEAYLHRTER